MNRLLALFALLPVFLCAPALSANQTRSFGWVEEGLLLPESVSLKLKLDTGALTSSIDASEIERFDKDGEKWVKFSVEVKDSNTDELVSIPFERKVIRNIKVRGAGGADRRPVVRLKMCIGNKIYDEEFSLNNRSKMLYPVLIGRRTLERLGTVDVTRTFTVEPKCKAA